MEERERRARYVRWLEDYLVKRIGQCVPPGIDRWEPAWQHVAPAEDVLVAAAHLYVDGQITQDELKEAAKGLYDAWVEAGEAFERHRTGRVAWPIGPVPKAKQQKDDGREGQAEAVRRRDAGDGSGKRHGDGGGRRYHQGVLL